MSQHIKKLPSIFQTTTGKKFFDATIDQVMSKKDSERIVGYLGRRDSNLHDPVNDFYVPEPTKNRTWWQLEPTVYSLTTDLDKDNIFFYEDLINYIDYRGGITTNHDRLFESEYYSFAPPIDYDMFVNYQNYYWIEQGLPVITLAGVFGEDIVGKPSYTTPSDASPPNLRLTSGMTIRLPDDTIYTGTYIVENKGGLTGLALVSTEFNFYSSSSVEFLPWDSTIQPEPNRLIQNTNWDSISPYWDTQLQPGVGDYITIQRGSLDMNSWSRTNRWFHIGAINATLQTLGTTSFPSNAYRALRPIIQFSADLELYHTGSQFKQIIDYGLAGTITKNSVNGISVYDVNTALGIGLTNGSVICFFNDDSPESLRSVKDYIYTVSVDVNTSLISLSIVSSVTNGDIVVVKTGGKSEDLASSGDSWFYTRTDGIGSWDISYNKSGQNSPPLFQLYDHNDKKLDDQTVYPGSSFAGSKIFSYKLNLDAGAYVDPVLGFPVEYTGLQQSTDMMFQNNLQTDRYVYNTNTPIDGYYYFKDGGILYNEWQLPIPERVFNEPPAAPPTYTLTPLSTVVLGGNPVVVNLTTTNVPDGTQLYWEALGTNSDVLDYHVISPDNGYVTVINNASQIVINTIWFIGTEYLKVSLKSLPGTVPLAETQELRIINIFIDM